MLSTSCLRVKLQVPMPASPDWLLHAGRPRQKCSAPPSATCTCRLYTDFVWRFSLPARAPLPYHRFKRGDTVILAPAGLQRLAGRQPSGGDGKAVDAGGRPSSSIGGSDRNASSSDGGDASGSSSGDGSAGEAADGAAGGTGSQLEGTVLEVQRDGLLLTVAKPVAEALGAAPSGV